MVFSEIHGAKMIWYVPLTLSRCIVKLSTSGGTSVSTKHAAPLSGQGWREVSQRPLPSRIRDFRAEPDSEAEHSTYVRKPFKAPV